MGVIKVNLARGKKLPVKYPVGVDIFMLMDKDTADTKYLTAVLTKVKPGLVVKPCHSHRDIEEIIYVCQGEGKVWVDGDTDEIKRGDLVFFPADSKHMVRNTGDATLELLCFFSSSNYRKEGRYLVHQNINFGED